MLSKLLRKIEDKHMLLPITVLMALCAVVVACAGDGCSSGASSIPRAGFYASTSGNSVIIDSISVYGVDVPGDSMLLRCARNVHHTYLPLRISQETTKYVIHYDQKAFCSIRNNDTITLHYKATPFFESDECGVLYLFDITSYECTNHLIESVEMVYPHVSNIDVETMKLYFRTEE